jgi:hypothetical protein
MSGFYDIVDLGDEGSKILAEKYTKEDLEKTLNELNKIEKNNSKALENLEIQAKENTFSVELNTALDNKNKLTKLKYILNEAINIKNIPVVATQGMLIQFVEKRMDVVIPQNITIHNQELKSLNKDVDLGTSINIDKQFLYNCRQDNMEVTNEVSFEIEMFFEPLAPIPLRLQHTPSPLGQEISFELSF